MVKWPSCGRSPSECRCCPVCNHTPKFCTCKAKPQEECDCYDLHGFNPNPQCPKHKEEK